MYATDDNTPRGIADEAESRASSRSRTESTPRPAPRPAPRSPSRTRLWSQVIPRATPVTPLAPVDGQQTLLVDPGSSGNLSGKPSVCRTAMLACRSPPRPDGTVTRQRLFQRPRPLNVSGVGQNSQQCTHDCEIPIAMTTTDGRSIRGSFLTPTVNGESNLPALLGLKALRELSLIHI